MELKPRFNLKQRGCRCGTGLVSNWDGMCRHCRGKANNYELDRIWQYNDAVRYQRYLDKVIPDATYRRMVALSEATSGGVQQ